MDRIGLMALLVGNTIFLKGKFLNLNISNYKCYYHKYEFKAYIYLLFLLKKQIKNRKIKQKWLSFLDHHF